MVTPNDVWSVLTPFIGVGEYPDGSNHVPPFTDWYYGWDAPWCAILESYGLAHAGFSDDDGETLNLSRLIPGFIQTTAKGFAFVPYLESAYREVGLFDTEPREGDLFVTPYQTHTGFVTKVNDDGSVDTLEGNYSNHLVVANRYGGYLRGFCHPPYDGFGHTTSPSENPSANVPPFPGTVQRGSRGDAVRQVQQRLSDRGWRIAVDGQFGPKTDHVVRMFQTDKGLETDGIVGPITWVALWTAPIT